jgi:hypothetical protein
MAQSKSSPSGRSGSGRSGAGSSRPGGKPGGSSRTPVDTAKRGTAGKSGSGGSGKGPATKPPARRNTNKKTIVNQKQTPWGLIATTAAVVVFAVAIVAVVIATHKSSNGTDAANPYRQPEIAAAKAIKGVTFKVEPNHAHTQGNVTVKYDTTPPTGGNHNQIWADCTGTVYSKPIANENAVHMLEHGTVWITYNADEVKGAALAALAKKVQDIGNDIALSPYPNLDVPVSLQSWGYQLKVQSPTDGRIDTFIAALRNNKKTTPEYGTSCSNPAFKRDPSTFGHPTSTYGAS